MTPKQLREHAKQWDDDGRYSIGEVFRAHADALEELARLRARLEIDFAIDGNGKRVPFPAGGPDGIACRDETIRLLEAALAESERKIERLTWYAGEFVRLEARGTYGEFRDTVSAYRAEFGE